MTDEDMSEVWKAWKRAKQDKRAKNRSSSARVLADAGIPFLSRNEGAHLIISRAGVKVDFWPGTGLWTVQGSRQQTRGVAKLVKFISKLPD